MPKTLINCPMLVSGCADRDSYDTQLLYFTCSSLSRDDKRIFLLSDRNGSPNVWVRELCTGEERMLTDNKKGILKSYVYFDGTFNEGLGKASVSLDCVNNVIFYIQDDKICKVDLEGNITVLNHVPDGRMTAFTHASADGKRLCVPMTDGRCLDFDPETEAAWTNARCITSMAVSRKRI